MHHRTGWICLCVTMSSFLLCGCASTKVPTWDEVSGGVSDATTALADMTGKLADMTGGLLGEQGDDQPSPEALSDSLGKLNEKFTVAWHEMIVAESETMIALDDQADADKLIAAADALEGKNDIDSLQKKIEISQNAAKTIDDKLGGASHLNDEAKVHLTKAVPHYLVGMIEIAKLPGAYQKWIKHAKNCINGKDMLSKITGGLMLVQEVPAVLKITSNFPDLLSVWGNTTHKFIAFAQGNAVDTGDLASKI